MRSSANVPSLIKMSLLAAVKSLAIIARILRYLRFRGLARTCVCLCPVVYVVAVARTPRVREA